MTKNDDYNYNFYRRMLQNIKQTKDVQGPDDEDMNKVSSFYEDLQSREGYSCHCPQTLVCIHQKFTQGSYLSSCLLWMHNWS